MGEEQTTTATLSCNPQRSAESGRRDPIKKVVMCDRVRYHDAAGHFYHESGDHTKQMLVSISIKIRPLREQTRPFVLICVLLSPIMREHFFIYVYKSQLFFPQFPSYDVLKENRREEMATTNGQLRTLQLQP